MKTFTSLLLWVLLLAFTVNSFAETRKDDPRRYKPKKEVGKIESFTLVDTETGADIRTLNSNDTIDALESYNIRVNTNGKVGSVLTIVGFLDFKLDNTYPFTVGGDKKDHYLPYNLSEGTYLITAIPFRKKHAGGRMGEPVTIKLTVLPDHFDKIRFVLVDAATDQDIMELTNDAEIDLATLPNQQLNIRADVDWDPAESVRFGFNGDENFRTENQTPYALFGDTSGDYAAWTPTEGEHTLTATAYSKDNASGRQGPRQTITFRVRQAESPATTTSYLELNNLLVIYSNTNGGVLPSYAIDSIMYAVEETNKFYWRQSYMSLNIKWTVYVIDEYLDRVHGEGYLYPNEVDADLRSRGFPIDSFDAVSGLVVGGGAYAWGTNLVLGKAGYFQVPWWDEHWLMSWFFVHEFHHILDAMFVTSGYPLYPHNHPHAAFSAGEYVPHSGSNWDLNAEIIKYWNREDWFALTNNGSWGTIETASDRDSDTIPDLAPDVPLDEERFGTSTALVDTDRDGLTDLQEAMKGIFATSNPLSSDTDADDLPDLTDPEPLYPINTTVPYRTGLTLEQDVTQWPLAGYYFAGNFYNQRPASDSSSIHFAYSEDNLYIAAKVPVSWNQFELFIDADNDGLFYGKDNINITLAENTITTFNIYHAEPDTFIVIPPDGISGVTRVGPNWTSFQLVIPKLSEYGLDLQAGKQIAISVHIPGYAFLLEQDDLLTLILGEPETQTIAGVSASNNLKRLIKEQSRTVYPNPAKNEIKVELSAEDEGGNLRILDTRCAERMSRKIISGGITSIDINTLSPGLYLLYIESDAGKRSYKFIKN